MFHAELVLVNGNIITMNSKQPRVQAIAIRDGKIVAVGTSKQILTHVGRGTEKIDLKGRTVIPGFVDAHIHGASLGRSLSQIDLRNVKSIKEIQQKVKEWTDDTPKGRWIIGRGWDQDKLAEHRYPLRFDLDQVAPDNPLLLIRVCGHLGVVNSEALKLAGITKETKTPKDGHIEKDSSGEPNGILFERALGFIFDVLSKPSEEDVANTCLLACQKMVKEGLTTVHWIIDSTAEMRALQELKKRNILPLRIYALVPVEYLEHLTELGVFTGFGDHKIKMGSVKIFADGSLGARTAALKEPYSDASETKGMLLYSQKQLEKFVKKAHEANLQLAIHAIGDRTIEVVLKTLEKILAKTPKKNHRHRLEHASVLTPKLIRKMKKVGVIASVQPHFTVSDFWITNRLGETRARWAYAFKSLLKAGIVAMGGSDAPIEPASPILGIHAAVAREIFQQEQITLDEALRLYTINAVYGSFEENSKGSIEKGKLADLVILSRDPYKIPPKQIKDIKVEMTIVGGNVVYTRKE
ncbi:MAG: amidohydrolase [Candidatus Bathyarchaeia archaeon]